jgi:hypothetical protein
MKSRPGLLQTACQLLAEGRIGDVGKRVAKRLWSHSTAYGLRRDLVLPVALPMAKIPIAIRKLTDSDVPALLRDLSDVDSDTSWEIRLRHAHLESGIPQCYVAVDQRTDTPCYFQWIMGSTHNREIQTFFHGTFPLLRTDEALVENAYTPIQYRGMGIMAAATARIAERALDIGARYVITFVDQHNVPSLKGCKKAGFAPYVERHEQRILFHSRISFNPVPEGFSMPHERAPQASAARTLAAGEGHRHAA